jgi:hypothetical protein
MVKTAIRQEFKKMAGIVALVTFGLCRLVKYRFANCPHVVMAVAAIAENFLVVNKGSDGKTLRCMTGLTHITGRKVIRVFGVDQTSVTDFVYPIVAIHAIGRHALMATKRAD